MFKISCLVTLVSLSLVEYANGTLGCLLPLCNSTNFYGFYEFKFINLSNVSCIGLSSTAGAPATTINLKPKESYCLRLREEKKNNPLKKTKPVSTSVAKIGNIIFIALKLHFVWIVFQSTLLNYHRASVCWTSQLWRKVRLSSPLFTVCLEYIENNNKPLMFWMTRSLLSVILFSSF